MKGQERDHTCLLRSTSAEGIQNNYIQIGGANTKIIVDGADAVGSFDTRSTVPWNIAMPPDGLGLTYKFLRMSASYSMLNWREMSCIPLAPYIKKLEKTLSRRYFHSGGATLENSTRMEPTPSLPQRCARNHWRTCRATDNTTLAYNTSINGKGVSWVRGFIAVETWLRGKHFSA